MHHLINYPSSLHPCQLPHVPSIKVPVVPTLALLANSDYKIKVKQSLPWSWGDADEEKKILMILSYLILGIQPSLLWKQSSRRINFDWVPSSIFCHFCSHRMILFPLPFSYLPIYLECNITVFYVVFYCSVNIIFLFNCPDSFPKQFDLSCLFTILRLIRKESDFWWLSPISLSSKCIFCPTIFITLCYVGLQGLFKPYKFIFLRALSIMLFCWSRSVIPFLTLA